LPLSLDAKYNERLKIIRHERTANAPYPTTQEPLVFHNTLEQREKEELADGARRIASFFPRLASLAVAESSPVSVEGA